MKIRKKLLILLLVCVLALGCTVSVFAASVGCDLPADNSSTDQSDATPANEPDVPPQPITLAPPIAAPDPELGILTFDVKSDVPPTWMMPWPVTRLAYEVYVDHPCTFEYTRTTDGLTGKPINWEPVEPVTLYQLPDGSWASAVTDASLDINELKQEQFYLVESDCYYRIIAEYGGRTKNLRPTSHPISDFMLHDIYSGILNAGRTGYISLELDENVKDTCIVVHRCRINIASVDGVQFIPYSYTTNINGTVIIGYRPATSENRRDYYTESSIDLLTDEGAIITPVYNVLY